MSRSNQAGLQNPAKESQKNFRAIIKDAQDVEYYVSQLEELVNSQSQMDSVLKHRQVDSLFLNGNITILQGKQRIAEMIQKLSAVINARKLAEESGVEIPSIDKLQKLVFQFMNERLSVLPSPYAPLCGALPLPQDQIIPNGYFVCVPNEDMYILAIVIGFDPSKGSYHVCDADPEATEVSEIIISADLVIPMPTSSPARRTKATTYAPKTRVYSLWPDEQGGWTTVFYPATVVQPPTTLPAWYLLSFDGDPPINASVPEKFVVPMNEP